MEQMIFNQKKNIKEYIFGSLFMLAGLLVMLGSETFFYGILVMLVGIIFIGFNIKYEITKTYNNKKHISLFNIPLFKIKLDFPFPDYVSLFATQFTQSNEYGAVSAIGHDSKFKEVVIRLFKHNKHLTVYRTTNYQEALNNANFLKDMLNIELYNNLEQ